MKLLNKLQGKSASVQLKSLIQANLVFKKVRDQKDTYFVYPCLQLYAS